MQHPQNPTGTPIGQGGRCASRGSLGIPSGAGNRSGHASGCQSGMRGDRQMMRFPNTVCIWTGRSIHPQGDGGEIAVFLSGIRNPSGNRKTGPMLQTYILSNGGANPVSAANDPRGAWRDACGGCALAHAIGGACYVNLGQAPLSIWQAWNRGSVPHLIPSQAADLLQTIAGQSIRLGSYGDPAAVPLETWKWLLRGAPAWTDRKSVV